MSTDKNPITCHTAPSGLRMVHVYVPGCPVGYTGLCVATGSRDEAPDRHGLAHFVEHTIFKGTKRRSPWHIINRMEAVGGELNAYTTKEETVVYSVFPGASPARAAELIADLATGSQFPERELVKEREVVADEIDSYLDSPSEAVYDDFEDLLFRDSGLGHNILGTREALDGFTTDVCRDYLARRYRAGGMVAFYAGAWRHERAFAVMERYYGSIPAGKPEGLERVTPVEQPPFDTVRHIDTHQCHTIIGARVPGLDSPQRYTLALLTNILGGPGMNSLLNVALRERRGLVYSVEASTGLFTDCGELAVYYGCDPADNALCRRLVLETLDRMAEGYITPRRLEAARKQYLGQLVVGTLNLESRVLGIARSTLTLGRALNQQQVVDALRAVTAADIASLAASLQPASTLTLGPA